MNIGNTTSALPTQETRRGDNAASSTARPPQGRWNALVATTPEPAECAAMAAQRSASLDATAPDASSSGGVGCGNAPSGVLDIPIHVRSSASPRSQAMQRDLDHASRGSAVAPSGDGNSLSTLLTGQRARSPGAAVLTWVIGNALSTTGGAMLARDFMGGRPREDNS